MPSKSNRREWLTFTGAAIVTGAALTSTRTDAEEDEKEKEVTAAEDLMREHGVLRRALLVYSEAAARLALGHNDMPVTALGRTARLFRSFGEDYHERLLEEQHVFVPLAKAGGANAALVSTLSAQHERGRAITNYIETITARGRITVARSNSLQAVLSSFVRMYEHHAAIEDTVIFPAWKAAISAAQYDELNDQFEELEHKMFGKDGFEDAVKEITAIEREFGLSDLAALTAPLPPALD